MSVQKAIEFIRDIAHKYRISGIYIVGGAVRDEIMYGNMQPGSDIDITSLYANRAVELGGLIAGELGQNIPQILHRTGTLRLSVYDVEIDFKGEWLETSNVDQELRRMGVDVSPITKDVYSRDFTINSLLKNIYSEKIYDISKQGINDIKSKIIKTLLPPNFACQHNPLIVLRAIRFAIYLNFEIDKDLSDSMKQNYEVIFKSISPERAELEVLKMLSKNPTRTLDFLEEYNLTRLVMSDVYRKTLKLHPAAFQEI